MKNLFMAANMLASIILTNIFLILAIVYLFKWTRIVLKPPAKINNTEIERAEKFKKISLACIVSAAIIVAETVVFTHFLVF